MIVVTGATGTIGESLLRELSGAGAEVRALSRNPPGEYGPDDVEWVRADLADYDALPDVFAGAERLFVLTANADGMVRLQRNAIRAAGEVGVRHVVKLSALGSSDHSKSVIGVWHHAVERTLREAGPEWTILRPHVFMQNLLDQRDAIREEGVVRSPSGEARIPMVDTRDIAAAAAAVLTGDGHEGARYTLTGPEPVSHRRATEILGEILDRSLEYRPETEVEAFRRLHEEGLPAWHIGAQLALAEYQRTGGGTGIVTDTVEELTGRPPRTFRDFAHDHAADFAEG